MTIIAGGWRHTVAADADGNLYGWGWNKVSCSFGRGFAGLPADVVSAVGVPHLTTCGLSSSKHFSPISNEAGSVNHAIKLFLVLAVWTAWYWPH
jgi:alpha-tubulin suppressor-like RCC1 family protein